MGTELKAYKAIDGGCNYLAVATLEEGLDVRNMYPDIPILCLGIILPDHLSLCIKNNITITINSLEYVKSIKKELLKKLKVHIKINTGMNRLGISDNEELLETIDLLKQEQAYIEGIYTHIYNVDKQETTKEQFLLFEEFVSSIKKYNIPIVHCQASEATTNYPKPDFVNGCRLGIIMYGFTNQQNLNLKPTYKLYSQIIQIHELKENETIGYNGDYIGAKGDIIGVACLGYADGIIRKNKERYVYIKNKKYPIVGNICMDMLFVKIDGTVNLYDQVEVIKDNNHILEIAKHLETIPYEILCSITNRVPKFYINK